MKKSNYFSNISVKKNKPMSKQRLKHKSNSQSETNSTIDSFYSISPSKSAVNNVNSQKEENETFNKKAKENNSDNHQNKSKSIGDDINLDDSAEFFTNCRKLGSQIVKKLVNNDKQIVPDDKKIKERITTNAGEKMLSFLEKDKCDQNKFGVSCFEHQDPPRIPKLPEVDCKINLKNDEFLINNDKVVNDSESKQCPLCFKFVVKHVSHMKSCAAKKNVSTEQLLAALRLQEKQTAERQALGLPMGQDRTIPRRNVKRNESSDPNLDLAMALSVSMQDQEEHKILQEAEILMEAGLEEEANQKRSTLEGFGFATSRPVGKTAFGKNKSSVTPVLLKRTKEDRERIITEKVAIILVGEDENSSSMLEEFIFKEPKVRSKNLIPFLDKDLTLWKKSALVNDQNEVYYVRTLSEFVSPSKTEISAGLRHLSQLPFRMHTPNKHEENSCGDDEGPKFPTPSSDIIKTPKLSLDKTPQKTSYNCINDISTLKKSKENYETSLAKKLSEDWHSLLGKKQMSDITIYCQYEEEIPAHKLVLAVRCQSVLVDVIRESDSSNSVREMLFWSDTSRDTCLAFLQYIYCGNISRISNLNNKELKKLKCLAKKYNVIDLLDCLKSMNRSSSTVENVSRSLFSEDNCIAADESPSLLEKKSALPDKSVEDVFEMSTFIEKSIADDTEKMTCNGNRSPDMFFDSDINSKPIQGSSKNNLDILASMVDRSQTSDEESRRLNYENNQLFMIDSEFITNEKTQNGFPKFSLVSDSDYSEHCNNLSQIKYFESTKGVKSDCGEKSVVKSQRISSDPQLKTDTIDLSVENLDSSQSEADLSDENLVADKFSQNLKTPSSNSSSTNISSDLLQNLNTECSKELGNSQKLNSISVSTSSKINCSTTSSIHSDSILRNSSDTKRKRVENEIPTEENSSSNKKICIDNVPCSQESLNKVDVFDLTQSSKSSDNVAVLSSASQDLIDPCQSTPGKSNEVEGTGIENNDCFIDSVWDGFDEMNFDYYNYSADNNTPKKCDSVRCATPVNISDEDTISPPLKNRSSEKNTDKRVCNSSSETVLAKKIGSDDLDLNFQHSDMNQNSNDSLALQLSSETTQDSNLNLTQTCVKCPILDLSKLSPSPENIVISDSDCDSPKLSSLKKQLTDSLKKDSLSSVKQLLDDSLEISDSVFNLKETPGASKIKFKNSEKASNSSCTTPSPELCTAKVSSLPDYSSMKTPALKRELRKYGLKPSLGRKKGKLMLRYIYEQLNSVVPQSPDQPKATGSKGNVTKKSPRKMLLKSDNDSSGCESDDQASLSSTCSSSSSCAILEENVLADSVDDDEPETLSQQKCLKLTTATIPAAVKGLIYNDTELHEKILLYEPIFLEDVIERLKVKGFKCKKTELMDYLDEQCVTFRSLQGVTSRKKAQLRREARKKKRGKGSQAPTSPRILKRGQKQLLAK